LVIEYWLSVFVIFPLFGDFPYSQLLFSGYNLHNTTLEEKMGKICLLLTVAFLASVVNAEEKKNSDPNSKFITELRQKAELGDANSQFNLGRCYIRGKGVEQDSKQAVYWFLKSAEQADLDLAKALFNLNSS
jgi:TPR repeat protein